MTKGRKQVPGLEAQIDALCKPWKRPEGQRGRLSAAQIEEKEAYEEAQRKRCKDLLGRIEMLEATNFDLKTGRTTAEEKLAAAEATAEAIQVELDAARGELSEVRTEIDRIHAAAKIQADLNCLMPGELRPTAMLEQLPAGVINSYQLQNQHGIFRLYFSEKDVELEVIPNDPTRSPRMVDVSYRGIPDESLERLMGILGLPADSPLPSEAQRRLRRSTHDAAHDARMVGLLRYLLESPSDHYGDLHGIVDGAVLLVLDDEAMDAFKGHLSHTENPAR